MPPEALPSAVNRLTRFLTELISETNGLSLEDTLDLAHESPLVESDPEIGRLVGEFGDLLSRFRLDQERIETLLDHPFARALAELFKRFPLPFHEEHIHLTGSLDADFIFPRLEPLLAGPNRALYEAKIAEIYGKDSLPIRSAADVDRLIRLGEGERFARYLKILYLPK